MGRISGHFSRWLSHFYHTAATAARLLGHEAGQIHADMKVLKNGFSFSESSDTFR